MKHAKHILALLALCASAPAWAVQAPAAQAPASNQDAKQASTLGVGDAAPALSIAKWIKGQPVEKFEKGKVYMVEFWATWCGPCITSMPHISELQKKYADQGFVAIGVTSTDTRGNTLEKVEKMVADKGATMGYTVAWDKERATNDAFMRAAEQNGIPCSFLVDREGKIAYIGHPMGIDKVLEQVVAGKHDIAKLKADAAAAKLAEQRATAMQQALGQKIQAKDWDGVAVLCDEMAALGGEFVEQGAMVKFQIMLYQAKDPARVAAAAKAALEGPCKDSGNALNAMAWMMCEDRHKVAGLDYALAVKIAERASTLADGKDPQVLDTLARAHFKKGDLAKAIEIQKQAVALDPNLKPTLDEYEAAAKK
jgi:thiol-disulfide isomerase/thioredoxin